MKKAAAPSRTRSTAILFGLVTSALACLCVGALLAVRFDGLPRLFLGACGFFAYLYFMGHALRELNLPSVLYETRPDPERRRVDPPISVAAVGRVRVSGDEKRPSRRRRAA